jgi:hypothetical protein
VVTAPLGWCNVSSTGVPGGKALVSRSKRPPRPRSSVRPWSGRSPCPWGRHVTTRSAGSRSPAPLPLPGEEQVAEQVQLGRGQVREEHPVKDATFRPPCPLGPHFPDDPGLYLDGPALCLEGDLEQGRGSEPLVELHTRTPLAQVVRPTDAGPRRCGRFLLVAEGELYRMPGRSSLVRRDGGHGWPPVLASIPRAAAPAQGELPAHPAPRLRGKESALAGWRCPRQPPRAARPSPPAEMALQTTSRASRSTSAEPTPAAASRLPENTWLWDGSAR